MIAGIGVDIVDLERFERAIARTPKLLTRLFTAAERELPSHSLAARFAAKEAVVKALGRADSVVAVDIEVVSDEHGNPDIVLHGALQPRGMPRWDDLLSDQDADQLHAYLISVQRQAYADQQKSAPAAAAPALKEGHL